MSPKQFLALILFYMSYLFFGASVYFTLEQELETVERAEKLQKRLEINGTYKFSTSDCLTRDDHSIRQIELIPCVCLIVVQ